MYAFEFIEEKPEKENMKKYEKPSRDVKEKPPRTQTVIPWLQRKCTIKISIRFTAINIITLHAKLNGYSVV